MKQWEAKTDNGDNVNESEIHWDLVKDRTTKLSLNNDGQIITLPSGTDYIQGKTASVTLGSSEINIESRYIGFIKNNLKVIVRVDEKSNNISIEIEDVKNLKNP
jgi:hypothetical protein